jgi:hypothetical protein
MYRVPLLPVGAGAGGRMFRVLIGSYHSSLQVEVILYYTIFYFLLHPIFPLHSATVAIMYLVRCSLNILA